MDENLSLETYNIGDLRQWLLGDGSHKRELNDIIEKRRAFSFINNPFATDDTVVIAAILNNDKVVAFDMGFPDEVFINGDYSQRRRIFWNSALYVAPEHEGKGYGAIVIGTLLKLYGDSLYDHAAVPASVANFKFLGLAVDYATLSVFHAKRYVKSIKGVLSMILDCRKKILLLSKRKRAKSRIELKQYSLEYVSWVDEKTYEFIKGQSDGYLLRTKKSFNWTLAYPFGNSNLLSKRLKRGTQFQNRAEDYQLIGVKVVLGCKLVGFYILNIIGDELNVKYIYYNNDYSVIVFESILEHVLSAGIEQISTYDKNLVEFIQFSGLFLRLDKYPISFTHPSSERPPLNWAVQEGDGDMFS